MDKYIKRLEDGNNRIMAIEIQSTSKAICLVNTYLLTQMSNSSQNIVNAWTSYRLIERYGTTHELVLCGDMNGTLINDRNNAHD